MLLTGCKKASDVMGVDSYQEGNKEVVITINYEGNLLFARDNLDIYIDNHKFYTVANGDENSNKYNLAEGTHTLKISAGLLHSKSVDFEVANTGDVFCFSTKNHLNHVELWMTESGNYYELTGQDIPVDSQGDIDQKDVKINDKSSSIWSKLWTGIKCILIFLVIMMVFVIIGYLINEVLKAINLQIFGIVAEFIVFGFFIVKDKFSLITILIAVGFVIVNITLMSKLKNVPMDYRNFKVVKETTNTAWAFALSYICPATMLMYPQIGDALPFTIHNLNTYLYVYIGLCIFIPLFGLSDLEFPSDIRKLINCKEILTEEDINQYIASLIKPDDTEDTQKSKANKVFDTLSDFQGLGVIKADDENKRFIRVK
jgi:hypothetical protein